LAIDRNEYPNKIEVNLWSDKRFEVFYYSFKHDGRPHRGLINLCDKVGWSKRDRVSVAKARLVEKKAAVRDRTVSDRVVLDVYMAEYFGRMPAGAHRKAMESFYGRYLAGTLGRKRVVDLRQMHVRDVMKRLEEQGLAPRTVKTVLNVLGPAMKEAIANRLIVHNPLDGIKVKIPKTKKIVTRASDRLVEIYRAVQEEFDGDPFYLALFGFALQGRRKSEILTLRWEDVSLEERYYVLRSTKNDEEQKIFLPESIKAQLKALPRRGPWVFQSPVADGRITNVRRQVAKLKRRLEDPGFGLHYLRNVIVSAMAEQGFDSIHLSGALGHADPTTINKYLTMNYLKSSEMASGVIDGIVKK
jgi:integrase